MFTSSKSSTVSIKVLRATSIAIRHPVDRSGILRRILYEPGICFTATASFNSLFVSSRLDSRELRSAARIAVRKARVSSQKDAPFRYRRFEELSLIEGIRLWFTKPEDRRTATQESVP